MSDQVSRGEITEHRARWGWVGMGVGSCGGGGVGGAGRGEGREGGCILRFVWPEPKAM